MKIRLELNDQNIAYPALLTNHDQEFVPAFVKFIFWDDEGVQIRPAPDDGRHLLPHQVLDFKRHVNLSSWSYMVAEQGLVILTWDPVSKSGSHRVKVPETAVQYDIVQELNPPAYARKGAQQLAERYKEEGHQTVEWYVAGGLDTALILRKKDTPALFAAINVLEADQDPAIRLDNIGLWPVHEMDVRKLYRLETLTPPWYENVENRRFKGREFSTLFWLRWNGVKNGVITGDTKVLAYLMAQQQPLGDTEVSIPEGMYVIKPVT